MKSTYGTSNQSEINLNRLIKDQSYNLWILLQQTKDALENLKEAQLAKINISNIEASVLFIIQIIEQTPGIKTTSTEISRWIVRKPHSVSTLLSRMEKKGLVQRSHDPERKNLVLISLTEKGYDAFLESRELAGPENLIAGLDDDERKALINIMLKLRDNALMKAVPQQTMRFPSKDELE